MCTHSFKNKSPYVHPLYLAAVSFPPKRLHYCPRHCSINQACVALGSQRRVLWGLCSAHEEILSCTMCFAGFPLHGDVCFLSSLVSLLLQTEASDRGISPPLLGKDAAGGRGWRGHGVVDFSWFLQPIGKCLGKEALLRLRGWSRTFFDSPSTLLCFFFFLSSVKSEDKGGVEGMWDPAWCLHTPLPCPAVYLPFFMLLLSPPPPQTHWLF